ncbi:transporter substrate-binding domain-containing protein [Aliirhizobium smilacinae]|uniref:Transporter substrate-binding domain-containing protein n=1 Tax=Aliirhizobium smilacinae TaxID=1395944 RepID=A0A5C4X9E9_9HYPH|nr:transporter substrate-binding domain-containing protein [Rhizobium smilacinae]TNM59909.1 transporter substrate-binding domain-containing protein [Rhizobium smilacinae]
MRKAIAISLFVCVLGTLFSVNASLGSDRPLRIGVEGALAPFNYTDPSGKVVGFDVELTDAILDASGLTGEWIRQDWDGLIPGIIAGKFDIVSATVSITEERKKRVDFTDPLYRTSIRFVAAKGAFLDDRNSTLRGKRLGAQRATVSSAHLQKHYPDSEVVLYDTQDALRLDLIAGRIDALIADQIATEDSFLKKPEGTGYEFFGSVIKPDDGIGIVLPKGHDELMQRLNSGIATIRSNGKFDQISEKYFGDTDLR